MRTAVSHQHRNHRHHRPPAPADQCCTHRGRPEALYTMTLAWPKVGQAVESTVKLPTPFRSFHSLARDPESSIRQTDLTRFRCVDHHTGCRCLARRRLLRRRVALPPVCIRGKRHAPKHHRRNADCYSRAEQCRSRAEHAIDPMLTTRRSLTRNGDVTPIQLKRSRP
jgi:hypothetical protein